MLICGARDGVVLLRRQTPSRPTVGQGRLRVVKVGPWLERVDVGEVWKGRLTNECQRAFRVIYRGQKR